MDFKVRNQEILELDLNVLRIMETKNLSQFIREYNLKVGLLAQEQD